MNTKQLFIGFIIILLATTLILPRSEEQRHCDQYSGESNSDNPSDSFSTCKTDVRCKVDQDSILTKDTDEDTFSFMCVPDKQANNSEFPK